MGFISTGNTLQLTAYLTQRGRDLLLNGSENDITGKFFALGDSDANYNVELRLAEGYVPDLTGDNSDCILSLANNVGIKHFVYYSDKTDPVIPTKKNEVRLQRTDNNKYYNVIDCLINLDSIGRYMLYHSSDNIGNANSSKVFNALAPIFTDLFKKVDLLNKGSETPEVADIEPVTDFDFELAFEPAIYQSIINTYLADTTTVNQSGNIVSPIQLNFSSRVNPDDATIINNGAGAGAIGIMGRELGYIYKKFDDTSFTFYNANDIENKLNYLFYTDENNQVLNKFTDFTLAARITTKNHNSGIVETFIARGDKNLANISETNIGTFTNAIKNANQHLKLFKRDEFGGSIVNGTYVNSSNIINDGFGIVQKEIQNLKDYVQVSPYFTKSGTNNEYRTSKLTFNIYPKGNRGVTPATLNIVFRFNEDIMLDGDTSYTNITNEGDKNFVQYDFTATNGVFQNIVKTGSFVRNNCGANSQGSSVLYTVPKGTYTGSTQGIADALAQADVSSNGQTYANTNGICTVSTVYYSAAFSGSVQKSDCPAGYYGANTYVNVPQGQFTSTISQYDANIQASNYASQYANTNGSCIIYPTNGGGGGCLVSGERILINDKNDSVAVEDLKVGDLVYTVHEKTREFGLYKVTHAIPQTIDQWIYIITQDGRTISCSPTHLFMVYNEKADNYIQTLVTDLKIDDKLTIIEGEYFKSTTIKEIIVAKNRVTIHKLEIEDAHTYVTDNYIWHHNKLLPQEPGQFFN